MKKRTRLLLLLFIVGFFETFPLGFLGVMPVDQSLVFEAAGRIVNGEVLFRDFYVSHGMIPCYIQALLFKIFGIKWWSYVLHAAVFNGLFIILVYNILAYYQPSKQKWNIFISIFSGWLFYPIVGTPYPENHSFFFGLLAIFLFLQSFKGKRGWLYFVFPCLLASYLSKPIPAVLFLVPIAVLMFFHPEFLDRKSALKLLAGLILGGLLFFVFLLTINLKGFYDYYIHLPASQGPGRILRGLSFLVLKKLANQFPLSITYAGTLSIIHFWMNAKKLRDKVHEPVFFSLGFLVIGSIFALLTYNQISNSFGILFIGYGILIPALMDYYGYSLRIDKRNILLISILLMTLSLDGARSINFNLKRIYNDIEFSLSSLKDYSKELGFFFQTPIDRQINFSDIDELIRFLKKENQPFCYFGDLTILNSLLHNKSPFPIVTFEYGLTIPNKETKEFFSFKDNLHEAIAKYNIKYLIIENEVTWMGVHIYDFFSPQEIQKMQKQYFGKIIVVTLS